MEHATEGDQKKIIFGASGIQAIMQNIQTIVSTPAGTVPLDRSFGIDTASLDGPLNEVTRARVTDRIVQAIREYEPRVEVTRIEYEADGESGRLKPIVKFRLRDGEET